MEKNCILLQVVHQLQQLSKLGSAYVSKPSVQKQSHHSAEPAAMSQ